MPPKRNARVASEKASSIISKVSREMGLTDAQFQMHLQQRADAHLASTAAKGTNDYKLYLSKEEELKKKTADAAKAAESVQNAQQSTLDLAVNPTVDVDQDAAPPAPPSGTASSSAASSCGIGEIFFFL